MKVLDPLIEGRRQRTVLREGRSDAGLRHGADAGEAEAGHQAPREELTPVDRPSQQLPARRLLQEVFLFLPYAHRHPQDSVSAGSRSPRWRIVSASPPPRNDNRHQNGAGRIIR